MQEFRTHGLALFLRATLRMFFAFAWLLFFSQCIDKETDVTESDGEVVIHAERSLEFVVVKDGFRFGFRKPDGTVLVQAHTESGLLAGSPEDLRGAQTTRYLGKSDGGYLFEVGLGVDLKILVKLSLTRDAAWFELAHEGSEPIAMALRTAGVSPGYGLGDVLTNLQRVPANQGRFDTEITGFESYDFNSSSGDVSRMVSNFAIYPANEFAVINIDPGSKIVVSTEEAIVQGSRYTQKIDALYFFFGSPSQIYKSFLDARNRHGFPVMKPSYEFYGVGWEAWGALAWKTSQETVKEDIDRYLALGYPLRWMVVGSGFWPQTADKYKSTTSFGMWDKEKYPNPEEFKNYFREKGLKFLIGLRIAFLLDGPFTAEGVANGYFIQEDGAPKVYRIDFPENPVHLLDAHNEKAVEWYVNLCDTWGVDGFKEDLYGYYYYQFPDDKIDPVNVALKEKGYMIMVRNAYLTSPGELHRIDDFNYDMNQDRGPVNSLTLAYSGFPLTYMDIIGGLFGGRDFDGQVSDRIKTYLMRNARIAALHPGMSMGKGPWHYRDSLVSRVLLESALLHARLHPYLYSNAIKFYQDGYPHTMTPLPIAFPDDPSVHHRENHRIRGYQWMIGDALMAYPLYGEDYETALTRDVYLPEGTWMDYDTGDTYTGPLMLKDFEIPVEKTPLFVGGTGILVEEIAGVLKGRVYPITERAESVFFGRDGETKSVISIDSPTWENPEIVDLTTGQEVPWEKSRFAIEFIVEIGHDYLVR